MRARVEKVDVLGWNKSLLRCAVVVSNEQGAPVRSQLEYSNGMLLGLTLVPYFVPQEGYLIVFSLGAMGGLMLCTWEGSLVF